MSKTRIPEIDKLFDQVLDYRRTADFKKLLDFVVKFRHLAPYNAMLIHIQKPGSTYVASAADWNCRFNRKVKPGARPLLILKPFGPVSFVFEYNDTDGHPLPNDLVRPFKSDAPISEWQLKRLINGARYDGIDVFYEKYGTDLTGHIQYCDPIQYLNIKCGDKEYLIQSNYAIVLNEELQVQEQFITLLHELGHFYCGHINCNHMKWLPDRTFLDNAEEEFEAEITCYLVCKRLGIENPSSVKYLDGYLQGNDSIPYVSVDTILRAAGIIETLLSGAAKPRKELILKEK